jgi:hypothetical protein
MVLWDVVVDVLQTKGLADSGEWFFGCARGKPFDWAHGKSFDKLRAGP